MEFWAGKVAIVTGASAGIGTATSKALVGHGVKVVGLARRMDKLQELAQELGKDKFYPLQCDVRKEEDIIKVFKWIEKTFGGASILVNNAGVISLSSVTGKKTATEEYRKVVETNLIAPAIFAREFSQSIKKRNVPGHIVNINSILGHYADTFTIPIGLYAPSKYGLTALGTGLRHEFIISKLKIKVTSVSPGFVMTEMVGPVPKHVLDNMPILQDKDIANAVIYALGTPQGVEIVEVTVMAQNEIIGVPAAMKRQYIGSKHLSFMDRWVGKVAIVTGASVGIGAAIAKSLVDHGVKVVGLSRRLDKLQELAKELDKDMFYPIECDLRKEEHIVNAFEWIQTKFGGADALINNAGVADQSMIIESPTEEYRKVLDTNVIAPAICVREFTQSIKQRKVFGHIININSMAGHFPESIHLPIGMYGASKSALNALSTEIRHEILQAQLNIKVTSISPGAVMTDMLRGVVKLQSIIDKIPTLKDKDIADAVIYALQTPQGVEVYDIFLMPQNSALGSSGRHLQPMEKKDTSLN
ncbi:uncharacterized short-chain type dehydrogenase/reductase y4vI-like [Hylaeus volcanicus]|uniref:uncharacterized short-chain type dehydrogenase/reductase y4vI-like n=2 Tax=Nesoprosopis TaxID=406334 RepID=UPI0023B840B6|nr:uncharacterized short-chain type dehydrogenase/reductase y4vI-like [Hylaeus volcanicus]